MRPTRAGAVTVAIAPRSWDPCPVRSVLVLRMQGLLSPRSPYARSSTEVHPPLVGSLSRNLLRADTRGNHPMPTRTFFSVWFRTLLQADRRPASSATNTPRRSHLAGLAGDELLMMCEEDELRRFAVNDVRLAVFARRTLSGSSQTWWSGAWTPPRRCYS